MCAKLEAILPLHLHPNRKLHAFSAYWLPHKDPFLYSRVFTTLSQDWALSSANSELIVTESQATTELVKQIKNTNYTPFLIEFYNIIYILNLPLTT